MSIEPHVVASELRQLWLPRINEITGRPRQSIADWLTTGAYAWSTAPNATQFSVDVHSADLKFREAFAAECSRFSTAMFESLLYSEPPAVQVKSLAWTFIRNYYAAFFGGHALLRILGRSVSYISQLQVNKINQIALANFGAGCVFIQSGIYLIRYDPVAGKLTADQIVNGNSHESFWREFCDELSDLGTKILVAGGAPNAVAAAESISALRGALCQAGSNQGAWLSTIRNSINYRHDFGIWYPYALTDQKASDLAGELEGWTKTNLTTPTDRNRGAELKGFVHLTNSIAGILFAVLKDLSARCPKGRSFVDQCPFALLRQTRPGLV